MSVVQLSAHHAAQVLCLMVPRGLEPRTLRLLAVGSNQLSYETSCCLVRNVHGKRTLLCSSFRKSRCHFKAKRRAPMRTSLRAKPLLAGPPGVAFAVVCMLIMCS